MDISTIAFLSLLNNRLIEMVLRPIVKRISDEGVSKDLLLYCSIISGIGIALASRSNLLADYFNIPYVGVAVTGVIIGGGSNLIHDLFGN